MAPLSKGAEDQMLRGNSSGSQSRPPQRRISTEATTAHTHTIPPTSVLQPERRPTAASTDDMIVDSPVIPPSSSSLEAFQSRRPERPLQRPPSVDLRRLTGGTNSPRKNLKDPSSSAPGNPLVSTPLSKPALPWKPSSLGQNVTNAPKVGEQLVRRPESSSVDAPSSKRARPVATRKDSLDIDMRGLKVGNVTPPQPSSKEASGSSSSTNLPGPMASKKAKASRPGSSSSAKTARTPSSSVSSVPGSSTVSVQFTLHDREHPPHPFHLRRYPFLE